MYGCSIAQISTITGMEDNSNIQEDLQSNHLFVLQYHILGIGM